MTELSQLELEAVEIKLSDSRRAFLAELSKHSELSRLWAEIHELEALAVDCRRGRREAEILEGGAA